ncbi:putative mediator of RNA polymerase II transcription subunit 26 [Nasonia vitripennis]|uniref:Uncharacterized protein n=1 Tax=Nasonia vitripennis TaxID=7425 RepID=A0A7M7GE32_NASVI|nr:putative mediator of RNA polymerase II transcription subunit 26 [Nasonia vitripennis]
MSCQHTSHHSHVLTVPQSTFCESPTALVDSHLHAHHQHRHHNLHQQSSPESLLSRLQRRRRVPHLHQSVSAQQLSLPSPPPRHQRQQKQQQLQLKFREQFEQQSLQKQQWQQVQQWQQQAQQWQQCQKCSVLQEHHHHDHGDAPRFAVNDSGASNFPNNLQRRVSLGSFSPSQLRQSAEVKTQAVQREYEYITLQVQENDTTQYLNLQFSQQNHQYQQKSVYKLFDDDSAVSKGFFSRDAPAKESDAVAPTTSFSYFNHNSVKEQSTLLSELSLDFLSGFEQFSLDGEIDFLKTSESIKEDKVNTFSYFTAQSNVNFVQPTIICSTNVDRFINPLEAAPDICQDARPGSAYYKITISTRSDAVLNESKDSQDKSATETRLCGLNKLQVFSEIQNLELLTSPKFNDFPQDLKEYLRSERMILADVRSIIASENSDILQSCNENNEEKKATVEVRSLENKTYANILQSVPRYDLNSSPTSDEHSCDMKPLQATRRNNRRSKFTNSRHHANNLKNGMKTNHNETSNSALALEKRKRTKVPYKFRKQSNNNKNSKIYNDSWRVETLSGKKRN